MPVLLAHQQVEDFDAWQEVFDSMDDLRRQDGGLPTGC